MSSLYARANSRQARVLRIVEGAVRNASHAHPGKQIDPRMARSIAKRAAGTLTAAWPDVLATPMALSAEKPENVEAGSQYRSNPRLVGKARGATGYVASRRFFHVSIGRMAGEARRAGNDERLAALIDVLRLLGDAP